MLGRPNQLHRPGLVGAGNRTTPATHTLLRVSGCPLGSALRIIFHLDGAKLAFLEAGSAAFAFFSVHHSFKAALGHPIRYLIFILPKHVPEWRAAAPVTIAYQLVDLGLVQ